MLVICLLYRCNNVINLGKNKDFMENERFSNLYRVSANIHVLRDSYDNKKSYFSTNLNLNPTINRKFVEFDKNHYDFYPTRVDNTKFNRHHRNEI